MIKSLLHTLIYLAILWFIWGFTVALFGCTQDIPYLHLLGNSCMAIAVGLMIISLFEVRNE